LPLKQLCLKVINNLKVSVNFTGEIVATILDKNLIDLIRLVSYGNGKIIGSTIFAKMLAL
jgi:hypothetical protein